MSVRRRWSFVAVVLLLAGLVVAGCGVPSSNGEAKKSAAQVFSDAKRATASASSVRIIGSISQVQGRVTLNVVDGRGRGGGRITENGASFQLVLHSTVVDIKAGAATWAKLVNPTAAQLLAGKWIQTTANHPGFTQLAQLLDVSKFMSALSPSGKLTKGRTTTFDGHSVVPVTDTGKNGETLYVAATGRPYILGVRGDKTQRGNVVFDQYNSAIPPPAPAHAINLAKLAPSTTT